MERPEGDTHLPDKSPTPSTGEQASAPAGGATPASIAPRVEAQPQRKTLDQRGELLARTIRAEVAAGGRIESQGDFQAVVVRGHINHRLHLILTIITVGLWAFVWLWLALTHHEKRQIINVDEFGDVTIQPAEGEMAADISSVLGAPQLAGTFVNPKGHTQIEIARGNRLSGLAMAFLPDLVRAVFRKRRGGKEQQGQASQAADESTPSFDMSGYVAVSADEVLIIQAHAMMRSTKIGPEILGRVPRSAVTSAELDRATWSSALRIGFANGGRWEFDVAKVQRYMAEQVVRALGGRVG